MKTLKFLLRRVNRRPLLFSISLTGLIIGFTASTLIYFWINNELQFDKSHSRYPDIHRAFVVETKGELQRASPVVPLSLSYSLEKDFPQIEKTTFIKYESEIPLQSDDKIIEVSPAYTDKNFFEIFDGFELTQGDKEHLWENQNSIVITDKIAHILFGNESAIGKIIGSNKWYKTVYVVSGVIRHSETSSIKFDALMQLESFDLLKNLFLENWRNRENTCVYILWKKNAIVTYELLSQLNNYLQSKTGLKEILYFEPIANTHLFLKYNWIHDWNQGDIKKLWVMGLLAFIIMVISCINFSILQTAEGVTRFKEIGIKKVIGTSENRICKEIFFETFVLVILSIIISFVFTWILLPWFNNSVNKEINFFIDVEMIGWVLLFTILSTLFAGAYPATYLASINPVQALYKGKVFSKSKLGFTWYLLIFQFTVSFVLITITIFSWKQLNYINQKDLGFNKENLIIIKTGLWYDIEEFKVELLRNPNIYNVTASSTGPVNFHLFKQYPYHSEEMTPGDSVVASLYFVDSDFIETYKIKLLEGAFLTNDYNRQINSIDNSQSNKDYTPIVINEEAVLAFNLKNAIGSIINDHLKVVGVVKNFHFQPLHYKIQPLVMVYDYENIMTLSIRINKNDVKNSIKFVKATLSKFRDNHGFSYSFLDDQLKHSYQSDTYTTKILIYASLVAILISLAGIISITSFIINNTIKEIGIKMIFGASLGNLLIEYNQYFFRIISISVAIGLPFSIYFSNKILEQFEYRVNLDWMTFVLVTMTIISIVSITVSVIGMRIPLLNPIKVINQD